MMSSQAGNPYANYSGTGNTLRCSNPCVRKLIVDTARYWVEEMHVDGFRFDLASALVRNDNGSLNTDDPIDLAPHDDPMGVRLIAEPWDAAGAYQLGRSFPAKACLQWNGRFRDDIRRFMRGDAGIVPALMQRLYGSDDLFPDDRVHAFHPNRALTTLHLTTVSLCTIWFPTIANTMRKRSQEHRRPGRELQLECGWEGATQYRQCVLELEKRQAKKVLLLVDAGERDAHVPRGRRVLADARR